MAAAREHPQVVGAAPFMAAQALMARGEDMKGAIVRGIDPKLEPEADRHRATAAEGASTSWCRASSASCWAASWRARLRAARGDQVTLVAPGGQVTPAGVVPRLKQFTVVGTFDSGHYEYDTALAMIHEEDAATRVPPRRPDRHAPEAQATCTRRATWPTQLAVHAAGRASSSATGRARTSTWFAAVQVEKRMMFIILTLIVAVAAFNLVSTLVMTVTDKRADIAILRTLGASRAASWASSWCRARWWA